MSSVSVQRSEWLRRTVALAGDFRSAVTLAGFSDARAPDVTTIIDFHTGEPGGTRTRDPILKRHMLCHLSYRPHPKKTIQLTKQRIYAGPADLYESCIPSELQFSSTATASHQDCPRPWKYRAVSKNLTCPIISRTVRSEEHTSARFVQNGM